MIDLSKPLLVIYHFPCADGFTAAWIVRKYLKLNKFKGEITYYPSTYNSTLPDVSGRSVIISDFSYPREALLKMRQDSASMLVLDHHKSAAKALEGLDFCRFDMEKSGAGLTWDYLFPQTPRPWLVDYVEDRDLWNWKLSNSRAVSAALDTYNLDFGVWDRLSRRSVNTLIKEGKPILKYQGATLELLMQEAREVELAGHRVLAVNSSTLHSELGNKLAKGRAFAIVWRQRSDGIFTYSLRSDEQGLDVSTIASSFGGGGHKHASAFTSNTLLFQEI